MTKDQVNTLKEVDDFYTRMTDFVIGDNLDGALLNVETTQQNSINLKYKTLDTVNGSKAERTKTIPAVSPGNGTAGVAGMTLVHDIPYFFDFYESGFTSLPNSSDITKVLIPKFQTSYNVFDDLYTDVPAIQNKVFANPKAGDRILIGSLSGVPIGTAPLWATVTSAQRISGVYSVTVDYGGDTYIFAYTSSNDTATLKVPWTKISPKRNVYTNDLKQLNPEYGEARIKDYLTPQVYRAYNIVYPVKPQTGDLMEEVLGDDESRFIPITALRNHEDPDEYTDMLLPESGTANAYTRIVLKNDLTAIKSRNPYYILKTCKRAYDGDSLLALDTVKAETIENSITEAYSFNIEGRNTRLAAQLPEVGDLIQTRGVTAPVCEVLLDRDDVQHTRWFYNGKLYEVRVNTALTRVPEDPKIIYDTTSGTLRDLYISAGAKYNEATGFYELNGLTDITEEQMRVIWQEDLSGWYRKGRTNLTRNIAYKGTDGGYSGGQKMSNICNENTNLEVFNFGSDFYASYSFVAFSGCTKLREVLPQYKIVPYTGSLGYNLFNNCPALQEVRFDMRYVTRGNVLFSKSPLLSKESVLSIIATMGSVPKENPFTITLHPTAYARLKDDADIVAALEAKGGIVVLISA